MAVLYSTEFVSSSAWPALELDLDKKETTVKRIGVLAFVAATLIVLLAFSRTSSVVPSVCAAGQRRWRIVNPSQNRNSVSFDAHGRNGNSTSDDWNEEAPVSSGNLSPGQDQTLNCDNWYSLDIKWHLNTSDYNPQTDTFYVSLVCYANNYVWDRANNVREYDFARQ